MSSTFDPTAYRSDLDQLSFTDEQKARMAARLAEAASADPFSCAFVPYCASVLGGTENQYEKPLFRVVIVQCAAHCEAVSMVNRSRKR